MKFYAQPKKMIEVDLYVLIWDQVPKYVVEGKK